MSAIPALAAGAPRRRRRPLILTMMVALVAPGGASRSIEGAVGNETVRTTTEHRPGQASPSPSPPPAAPVAAATDRPIADDDMACWTDIAIYSAGAGRPRPVVVFDRPRRSNINPDGIIGGVVAREILRQGLILAARDGFDVTVRDLVVGDPAEPGPADATYRLGLLIHNQKRDGSEQPVGARIAIVGGSGPGREVIWHRWSEDVGRGMVDYFELVNLSESLAQNDFREVLAGWRLPARPTRRAATGPAPLPDGVEPKLTSLAETDQFVALRALHDAVRREGGSARRWAALARGYAMLGSLTEPLLSPAHAAFKARSLLHAQQATNAASNAPWSLRERAFAEALAGLAGAARIDLDLADGADGRKGIDLRSDTMRAFLALDPDALGRLADRAGGDSLPLYLRAVALSRLSDDVGGKDHTCRNEIIAAAEAVLAQVPDCHRAVDIMCDAAGVAGLHRATRVDLESFVETSARRVAALPGLPPAVADRIGADPAEADEFNVRQALVKAAPGDPNDLSWGALANLLREIRFLQVARRLHFLRYAYGTGAPEFVEEARPMVADHPNHDFVELYAGTIDRGQEIEIIDRLDLADLEVKNYSLLKPIRLIDRGRSDQIWYRTSHQTDWGLVAGAERHARSQGDLKKRMFWIEILLYLDPASPVGRDLLVDADWQRAAPQVADWEREQPWNTSIFADHAFQLLEQKNYADAQPLFERALGRSSDLWIYRGLVACYRDQGRIDEWTGAANAFMEHPDQALDHAGACDDLAKYLMKQGDADRAWPWAERGAESYAAWAMTTAWQCAERRRDWANAELWVARRAQSYDDQWLGWLTWSLRTEHGHVPEAAAAVWAQWDVGRAARSEDEEYFVAILGLICGRPDVTRAIAEKHLAAQPNSTTDVADLILACDGLGDAKGRDEAMDRLLAEPKPAAPKTTKILATLIEWHRHRDAGPLSDALDRVRATVDEIPAERRPRAEALVGQMLLVLKQPTEAIIYLKRADVAGDNLGLRLLARHALAAQDQPRAEDLLPPGQVRDQAPPEPQP